MRLIMNQRTSKEGSGLIPAVTSAIVERVADVATTINAVENQIAIRTTNFDEYAWRICWPFVAGPTRPSDYLKTGAPDSIRAPACPSRAVDICECATVPIPLALLARPMAANA
jgi:hypothetical protein